MPDETMMRELFDRWERVWHDGRHELIPGCAGCSAIRHNPGSTRGGRHELIPG